MVAISKQYIEEDRESNHRELIRVKDVQMMGRYIHDCKGQSVRILLEYRTETEDGALGLIAAAQRL